MNSPELELFFFEFNSYLTVDDGLPMLISPEDGLSQACRVQLPCRELRKSDPPVCTTLTIRYDTIVTLRATRVRFCSVREWPWVVSSRNGVRTLNHSMGSRNRAVVQLGPEYRHHTTDDARGWVESNTDGADTFILVKHD